MTRSPPAGHAWPPAQPPTGAPRPARACSGHGHRGRYACLAHRDVVADPGIAHKGDRRVPGLVQLDHRHASSLRQRGEPAGHVARPPGRAIVAAGDQPVVLPVGSSTHPGRQQGLAVRLQQPGDLIVQVDPPDASCRVRLPLDQVPVQLQDRVIDHQHTTVQVDAGLLQPAQLTAPGTLTASAWPGSPQPFADPRVRQAAGSPQSARHERQQGHRTRPMGMKGASAQRAGCIGIRAEARLATLPDAARDTHGPGVA